MPQRPLTKTQTHVSSYSSVTYKNPLERLSKEEELDSIMSEISFVRMRGGWASSSQTQPALHWPKSTLLSERLTARNPAGSAEWMTCCFLKEKQLHNYRNFKTCGSYMAGAAAASGAVSSEGGQWHMTETGEIFSAQRCYRGARLSLEQQAVWVHRGGKEGERYWRQPPHEEGCPVCQPALVMFWDSWSLPWDQDPECCQSFSSPLTISALPSGHEQYCQSLFRACQGWLQSTGGKGEV